MDDARGGSLKSFFSIWFGQLISWVGSGLTTFAFGVWLYQRTGSVTQYAVISLLAVLPLILISPGAGFLVDRLDRRRIMLASDFGAALCTLAVIVVTRCAALQLWEVYAVVLIGATLKAFHGPAFASLIPSLVPPHWLSRANGLVQLGVALQQVLSPMIAGHFLDSIGIKGLIIADLVSYLFAILFLLPVRGEPAPERNSGETLTPREMVLDAWYYLRSRPGIFPLLLFMALVNFLAGFVVVLSTPLILSFGTVQTLGNILSLCGIGMVAGSLFMSSWKGGANRKLPFILRIEFFCGICILLAGIRASAVLISTVGFIFFFSLPVVNGTIQTILQMGITPTMQGRVFALSNMISSALFPIAYLIAGPLADYVFEPLMRVGGPLSGSVGLVIGVGPGRGIGLLFFLIGILTSLTAGICSLSGRFVPEEGAELTLDDA